MKYIDPNELTLVKDGVQVFPGVLSAAEVKLMQEQMWEYLAHLTKHTEAPVDRAAPATYKSLQRLVPLHAMMLRHWDIGHNPMSWFARQHPNVLKVFGAVWGAPVEQLVTNFDGISIMLPPEFTGNGWYRGDDWLHCDQSYTRPGRRSVQSFVTLFDAGEGDATLRVLRGSHKYHTEFGERFGIADDKNWFRIDRAREHWDFYRERGCEDVCLNLAAGSMVIWDSRTIHQGMVPQTGRAEPRVRCVLYICMFPRDRCDNLKKRQRAFTDRRTTDHLVDKIMPVKPRSYGKELPVVEPWEFEETPLMRRLAGFD